MDTNAWWYIDGRWVHPNGAVISINDVAVLRGYGYRARHHLRLHILLGNVA